jgi:2-succinyl-5-enolpyruvyl-6-hydroxy-3-cyclohexene-1-carboxylate synthase
MALALVAHRGIAVQVFHDERSAAFAALGHGLATQRPALVLCSSGTAGAHFYAAVIEADASAVPLIVVTADRPPELWGRGAPQTIDQTHLYGTHVRDFVEPGVAEDLDPTMWRPLARRLWNSATRPIPGPVHANLSFRDPLTGTPGTLPEPIEANEPIASATAGTATIDDLQERLSLTTGVIVAGRSQTDPATILKLAEQLGWPVLADHRSGCRSPRSTVVVRCFDSLLRSPEFTSSHRPNVVLRIGEIVASKSLSQWLSASAAAGTTVLSSRPHGRSIDPESIASIQFDEPGVIAELADRLTGPAADTAWLTSWSDADRIAAVTIDSLVANGSQPSEIAIAQACVRAVPSGGALVLSSSMPVRDVEHHGHREPGRERYRWRGGNRSRRGPGRPANRMSDRRCRISA